MLYEKYAKRMETVASVQKFIKRYRIYFIILLSLLLVLAIALMIARGTISGITLYKDTYVYGEEIQVDSGAFLTSTQYEHCKQGSTVWTEGYPRGVGNYSVRAYAYDLGGNKRYSSSVEVTINPVDVNLIISTDTVIYGDLPILTGGNLQYQDTVICDDYDVIFVEGQTFKFEPNMDNVRIVNANGDDVTECYNITYTSKNITLQNRDLTLDIEGLEVVYDGNPHSTDKYSINESTSLANGDQIIAEFGVTLTTVGEVNNIPVVKIINSEQEDVTHFYNINYNANTIRVLPRDARIVVSSLKNQVYSGTAYYNRNYTQVAGYELINGDTYEVVSSTTLINVGSVENVLELKVRNKQGFDVTNCYNIEQTHGTLSVIPRTIHIYTPNVTFEYDGKAKSNTDWQYSYGTPNEILPSHKIISVADSSITNVGQTQNIQKFVVQEGKNDVTSNYNIVCTWGKLTVNARKIEITSATSNRVYNGLPYSDTKYTITSSVKLASGHSVEVVEYTEITNVGWAYNVIKVVIYDKDKQDVTSNYNIIYQKGVITVDKRDLKVKADDASKVYDGQPLVCNTVSYLDQTSLANGQQIRVTFSPDSTITNVGVADNNIVSVSIFSGGQDVTNNYSIQTTKGTLTIESRELVIVADSVERVYDTKPLTSNKYSIAQGSLVSGHTLSLQIIGEITNVGFVANQILAESVSIMSNGVDVTDNYNIVLRDGSLTILPRPITITTSSNVWEYDAQMHSDAKYNIAESTEYQLVAGHRLTVISSTTIQNVGIADNIVEFAVMDSYNQQVTANYKFIYLSGKLEITPRNITISTGSDTKLYDGLPLTNSQFSFISNDKLLEGHEAVIAQQASLTNVGELENQITLQILDQDQNDVTQNYNIMVEAGTLMVIVRDITVQAHSDSKVYDGTPLTVSTFYVAGLGLAEGQNAVINTQSSLTYVGQIANEISIIILDAQNIDVTANYKIQYQTGTLEVTHRYITVSSASASKIYDTLPLTADGYEIVSETKLPDNHVVELQSTGSQTEIGSSENIWNRSSLRIYKDAEDVTSNFIFAYENGTLTVNKRPITVTAESAYKVYDGTPLTNSNFKISTEYGLISGHTAVVQVTGSQTEIGTGPNRVTNVQILSGDTDVTEYYEITFKEGVLVVTDPQYSVIVIKPVDAKKQYDGTPLVATELEAIDGNLTKWHELLQQGYTYQVEFGGSQTEIGQSASSITRFEMYNPQGEPLSGYEFVFEEGLLTVISDQNIIIHMYSMSKKYDGTLLAYGANDYYVTGLPQGYKLEFNPAGIGMVNAGTLDIQLLYKLPIIIYDNNMNDVTTDYEVVIDAQTLMTITPRDLTIKSVSDTKLYDGTALTNNAYWISWGSVAQGQRLEVVITGTITDVGSTNNTIESVTVFDADGNDVTYNYKINKEEGTLTVM